jgi:hypothetical protein
MMIRLLLFCIAVSLTLSTKAQINLVPNPSFEDTVYCSDQGRLSGCKYWVNCRETPDYNHSCHEGPFDVPDNYMGYQYAATGEAYCQLWTYSITGSYREYIGVALTQPMVIGQTYAVSFKCSPGAYNNYCLQTNKLGIRFSTVPFDSANPAPIDNFAHVYTEDVVTDTSNWTVVTGSFTADSTYTFLVLGNFFSDENTDTIVPDSECFAFAVYYVDDVVVMDTSSLSNGNDFEVSTIQILLIGNSVVFQSPELIKTATLFNMLGETCGRTRANTLDVSSIARGFYLLQVESNHQTYNTTLFIH